MKRAALIALMLCSCLAAPGRAAEPRDVNFSLGFHDPSTPIGVRWWLPGHRLGFDLGLGGDKDDGTDFHRFSVSGGLPVLVRGWQRVDLILRPGVDFTTEDAYEYAPNMYGYMLIKRKLNTVDLTLALEAEVFVFDRLSVSAAHGILYEREKFDAPDAKAVNRFAAFGAGFTELGFHLYFGGQE